MRDERKQRRYREGNASLKAAAADSSGKLVLEVKSLSFNYDEKPLVKNFSTIIGRGYKIGIIGPNGCGKTTLVNLLLGKLKPQSGTVRQGSNLQIVYFDQMRGQLDPEKSVCENVLSNGDMVTVDGRTQHIITYLKDFLFTPERSKSPVSQLSGGERNRLLLARLFTKPANVLVFDEPTNDLDAETLELLEELLVNFKGTVLLISHDRAFLNNIVSSTFVFEGQGRVKEYIGGYDDWLLQKQKQDHDPEVNNIPKTDKKKIYQEEKKDRQKKKLSYKETQELKELPASIEAMEEQQKEINSKMADPGIYRIKEEITGLEEELKRIEARLQAAYARWEYLESLK
jgi:ATP-binding cassette subfamily F protein uup